MSARRLAGLAALAVAIAALARSTSCSAGWDVIALTALTAVLAAVWNDNPERGVGARIAKFLVIVFMAGMVLFGSVLLLNGSACS